MERGRAHRPEARVLLLHIGGPKCGSSALQRSLSHGRCGLARPDIHYTDQAFGIDPDRAVSHNQMMVRLARAATRARFETLQISSCTPPAPTRLAAARAAGTARLAGIDLQRLPGRSQQL